MTTIYETLVKQFGEEPVQAWALDRTAEKSSRIEARYCELKAQVRAQYEALGVAWKQAPMLELFSG